jgi:hypothetical protein
VEAFEKASTRLVEDHQLLANRQRFSRYFEVLEAQQEFFAAQLALAQADRMNATGDRPRPAEIGRTHG